jgi:hypothetical protein
MPADQMSNEKTRPAIPIQDELPVIIRALRQPAGDDPRFQSMELIRQNRAEFLKRVHATWKQIHNRSLEEILQIEAILTPDHPLAHIRRKGFAENFAVRQIFDGARPGRCLRRPTF